MEDNQHKTGLYRWERLTKPRVYSRSQKFTTNENIEDWLQKVEEASSRATEAVLVSEGLPPFTAGRHKGRAAVQNASDQARIQNEAYAEARDLLNEWLTQKVQLHDMEEEPELEEDSPWRKEDLGSKARQHWDNLLGGNLEELGINNSTHTLNYRHQEQNDPYANLYELDEAEAVSAVIKNMLDKDLIKGTLKRDLGFNDADKIHDPRTKMELRHQQVKEKRQKREDELKRQRRQAETKKQASLTARQMVMKEEKEKELKKKKEELEIRKQMAEIRKAMQETRRQETLEMIRQQQDEEEKVRLARQEVEQQQHAETQDMLLRQRELSQKQKSELAARELQKARQAADRLRVLHQHFTAWYDIVLYRRLSFGKARALADWRLTLRIWNAWRSYARSKRLTVETKRHEQNVLDENRKTLIARRHHYLSQLSKLFFAWREFVTHEQEKRNLENAQQETRSKMMNLLSAVADSALRAASKEEENKPKEKWGRNRRSSESSRRESTAQFSHDRAQSSRSEHNTVFSEPSPCIAWEEQSGSSTISSSRPQSANVGVNHNRLSEKGQRLPTQPWQIIRRHAQLSKEEITQVMKGNFSPETQVSHEGYTEHSGVQIRRRFGTQPWMNRHYTVNNFEHRFTAQQKMLRDQQTAIREQKQLIEELKFTQQQQSHYQHLAHITSDKLPAGLQGPDSVVAENGDGNEKKTSACKTRHNHIVLNSKPTAQHTLSDGGDSSRSQWSITGSDPGESEVTAASAATSNTPSSTKYLKILHNMEKRSAERAKLKAEREDKRRKAEDERLARLKAEEEELKRRAEEEKQAKVQAYKEKKRLEKQKEQAKQKELALQKELHFKAETHYQRALMKFRVLLPMKKLVQMAQEKMDQARDHHNHQILRRLLKAWKGHTDEVTLEKKQQADNLHSYLLLRHCLHSWKNFKYRMIFLEQRAERHHRYLLLPKVFQAWQQHIAEEKLAEQERLFQAQQFYPRSLVKKVFHAWRRLPQELRREADRAKLRAEMRKKVTDLLPDFEPSVSLTQSIDSTT